MTDQDNSTTAYDVQFAGLSFRVDPGVFAPFNPNASSVVDVLLESTRDIAQPFVVDVGTGTGALAITYALRRPDALVCAVDNSAASAVCARNNALLLGADNVRVFRGSLLEPISGSHKPINAIVANLPWVAPAVAEAVDLSGTNAWRGPHDAVVGKGHDGLDLLRELIAQSRGHLAPNALMMFAMDAWQVDVFMEQYQSQFRMQRMAESNYVILRTGA
jgi:release factor glutamine methyltransferase